MVGERFGSLAVTSAATRGRYWCKCNCGSKGLSMLTVRRKKLLSGEVTHCTAKLHAKRDAK